MNSRLNAFARAMLLISFLLVLKAPALSGRDYYVSGVVTDSYGATVANARVSMMAGTTEYSVKTGADGRYTLRLSNLYDNIPGSVEVGVPYPNPFTYSVNIPFIINRQADIRISVYSFSGQKVMETFFGTHISEEESGVLGIDACM